MDARDLANLNSDSHTITRAHATRELASSEDRSSVEELLSMLASAAADANDFDLRDDLDRILSKHF